MPVDGCACMQVGAGNNACGEFEERRGVAGTSRRRPKTQKEVRAVKLVYMIMVEDDADATLGCTPKWSISGTCAENHRCRPTNCDRPKKKKR